jgi:glycosyltransferase involved in cell wall biosynthesis
MAVSESTAQDIKRFFHRSSTATLIPLAHLRLAERQHLKPAATRKPHIIYNGGMDTRKNVPAVVEAFALFLKNHPGYKLIVMGKHTEKLLPQITALGIVDSVVLTGYVSQQQKFDMLCEASIVAYPSSLEGYGLPIVEAMLTHTPIVCGKGGAQAQTAGQAGIFADPVTPQTIARGFEEAAALFEDQAALAAYRDKQAEQLAYLSSQRVDDSIIATFQ